ncbi:signal peptide and transmembrane domain-containing protein [Cryptosporidium canis]|uniref:Signal peptide and transmembrane domain-containing protein n=1 Tax=Cryptosporidium canis TaxID=195482 RepID=A0A9D5HVG7_9CRYT|nr:signal peptide and transmembrane domain-containing protein [Cryptosporidium canis]
MKTTTKVYLILYVVILHIFNSFGCVSSDSQNKIDPVLALLPWTLNNSSSIEISVANGCYNWKFDHEFIKTKSVVLRTDSFGNNCTDVLSVNPTWPHMDWRGVFTIIASDIYTGENLRSEVHIAKVERIITSTSSKRIRLGSLENLFAVGFDNEFNTFTSLNGLTIVWELENDNIESDNTFGSQILIVGSKVGSVNVHAKIVEEGYSLVSPPVTIYVEDPFRITPRIRRAPFGSLYQIHLTKDGTINNANCFSKEYHLCEVDKSNEAEAQIIEGNKLILGKYNNQYNDTEIMISVTCFDRRVNGSFSNGFVYVSLPIGILFAIQDRVSLADSRKHVNIDEFSQTYFVEGEHFIEKSGIFRILKDSELTIVQNTTAFLQIKLFNSNGEFLHVPINSEFDIVCKIGCSLVKMNSSKNEYIKDRGTNNGFLEITGNLIGQSEVIVKLNSIGGMDYSKSIPHVKLSEIISTLKINVIRNVSTTFSKLPLILYPGGQEINIKSSIEGGKGPFYFCSSDPLIAIVDFYTGLLKTNNMTGVVNVHVYDIGTANFTDDKHIFSCETLKDTNSLKIPVCIAYINDFYLQPLSSSSKLYNNTLYTSISQNLLNIEIKATPDKNFTGFSSESKDKQLLSSMTYTKLDTLDILKLFDPCKIIEITNIYEFQPNIQYLHTYDTMECILILENLNVVSYRQISQDYDTDIIKFDIFEQQINIELKKHGYLNFERFIEFGIEFVYKSEVVRRSVLSIGLSINILQEISFTPLLNGIVSSYLEAYNTPKNICIEKSSKVALQLGGGLIENQDYVRLSIEYHKFKLILLEDNKTIEFKGTLEEIDNHKSIQVIQDGTNRFILQCNGDVAIGSFKFSMAIFDERSSELYRMESILKVSCLEISHINMFWVNIFPLVGKYACNTRNDNCLVYHFNSRVRHRFITLAYDIDNNLLLSYNSFATKWEIQHANDYSIDFVEENNELTDGNVIELFVNLGSEYSMKDVNIIFEAHSPNSEENSSVQFRITTKGIFTIPPTLISPNMLNMHSHFNEYHRMEEKNGINFAGSWNLIKGQHQFGIIYGTSNFNVFIDDGSNIKYGLCDQKKQKESVFSIENGLNNIQNDKLNILPFCLDSTMFSGNDNMAQKLNIYIEDQLILPKYVLKKELIFSSLSRLELIWLDRIGSNEIIQGNSLSWETYFTYNNDSDPGYDSLYRLKIPKQYISFIRDGLSGNYFEESQNMGNTLPCINGYYCLVDNKSKSLLIVIVYNEEGAALEPWQQTELNFEIEHKIIASYEPILEIDENVESSLSKFPVEINYRGLNTFQIVEIKEKNVDIELIAKVLGNDLDSPVYSNALVLYVYESIELESDSDVFSLFPNGPPLQIGYKGGPRMLENLKLEWDVQLERLPQSKGSNDDVLIIRDKHKMVIEPLEVVGSERVSIKCFITEIRYPSNFKALIFSRLIDVYVDVPDRIDVFSPDQEYLYLGYPKVYRIRAWKSVDPLIPNFHYSQYFPSKVSRCSVTWSINQHIDMANYNGEVTKNFVCNPQSDLVCISNFFIREHRNKLINDPALIEHNMYSQIYLHGYTVLLHPMKIGASNLKVRLHCNFGYKTDIELEYTQKLTIFSAIHSIENGIWINKDSFYYFSFPKQVIINSNSKLDIKHSNSSQTIYLNTWNSSKSIVIFNDERRFEVESGLLTTVSPIIVSEPKTTFMEFDLIDEYSIKLSLNFFNSMGIMLFPNQNYCNGLKLYLIPVSNVQEFVIIKGSNDSSSKGKLTDNLVFEESNLIKSCQFVLKQNSESSALGLLGIINSWKIIDSSNQLNINRHYSCYMIQIYSSKNILVGSQPLCVEFNHSKSREVYEFGNNVYDLGLQSTGNLATRSIFHEFEVFSGSFLHLNPIKWKVLNSYPKNLNFCVVVDGSLNDLESLFIEELSNISNVPLSFINIAHNLLIELKSSNYFNIPSSNKQLVCVTINREIDPFEFWMALMKYSSIICKSYGVFWADMDSDDAKNDFKDQNLEYRNITPIWEILSHKSSANIIENQILVIHSVSSNERILLRLSNYVEINLKVIPINDHIHKSRDILNKKHEILKLNDQFSFSIYLNENNDPVNKYFNNIYYSSPFVHVHCDVSDPILREIYTATPYWSLGIPDGQFLLPSCNLVPRDGVISEELLSKIVNNYKSNFMYISSKATNISFNIEIKLSSSEKIWRSVPVSFYPILIKPLSSSIFSSELIFKHNWINNTSQIKMTVPFSSVHDYRLPIRAIFWFGSLDTKLIAYSIENSTSNEYIVRYTPYNLEGEISISKNVNVIDSNDSYFSLTLPLHILLVLESSELKYHIDIFFERGGTSNLLNTDGGAASKHSNFSEFSRLGLHTYIACISLAAAYILHFLLNRRYISTKEINSSPFRKINTQKW